MCARISRIRAAHPGRESGPRLTTGHARTIIRIMNATRTRRAALWAVLGVLALAGSLLALEGLIRLDARHVGNEAAARFGGDRITGLTLVLH